MTEYSQEQIAAAVERWVKERWSLVDLQEFVTEELQHHYSEAPASDVAEFMEEHA